jgi:anti-anti-sigma factor
MKSPRPWPQAVELDEVDGFPRLRLCGECGGPAAGQLRQRLDGLIAAGRLQILLDTREIAYLDPSCHAILADAIDRIRAAGGAFVIVDQSSPVERILKLLNLEAQSQVVPTTSQAIGYLRWCH